MSTINPGIRRVVALLDEAQFTTCDSGDGETHDHPCDRGVGYVVVTVAPHHDLRSESHRLAALLMVYGVPIVPIGEDGGACIQATYDPTNGIATIDVSGIHDRMIAPVPS